MRRILRYLAKHKRRNEEGITLMSSLVKGFAVIAIAFGLGAPANAQGVLMQRNVSLDLALEIANAARAACREAGYDTSVAVVDRSGQTVVIMRSDTASPQTAEMARRKAYTARMWRRTSADWATRTREDPVAYPQRDLADVIALSGGVPIMVGDETIGGIGSAGSNQPQDDACAQAGVDAVAAQLQ